VYAGFHTAHPPRTGTTHIWTDKQAAPAPAAPAATEATLDDEDDDASGPSILLRAAAEVIVDEAERDSHIDAAEALLALIPSVDLETSSTWRGSVRVRRGGSAHGGEGQRDVRGTWL